jgi:hypothetical protein
MPWKCMRLQRYCSTTVTMALDRGEWLASHTNHFIPWERGPNRYPMDRRLCSSLSQSGCCRILEESLAPARNSKQAFQPVTHHCTDWAITAPASTSEVGNYRHDELFCCFAALFHYDSHRTLHWYFSVVYSSSVTTHLPSLLRNNVFHLASKNHQVCTSNMWVVTLYMLVKVTFFNTAYELKVS